MVGAPRNQRAAAQSGRGMQRSKKSKKSLWEIGGGIEIRGRGMTGTTRSKGQRNLRWIRLADRVAMVASRPFRQILTKARLGIGKAIEAKSAETAIPKSRSLKKLEAHLPGKERSVQNAVNQSRKICAPSAILSFAAACQPY